MSDNGRSFDEHSGPVTGSRHRLTGLVLDPSSIKRGNANIEHEREVAIFDILDANGFELVGHDHGPYHLVLSAVDDRLVFTVTPDAGGTPHVIALSLVPLRKVMKDYFLVCETYFDAIRTAPPSRIQQIDVGRRALHDEGAQGLVERLAGKIVLDTTTARRMFTLICALHWKG